MIHQRSTNATAIQVGAAALILCMFVSPRTTRPLADLTTPRYTVTDLGIDIRTAEHGPRGINAAGDIVGTMDLGEERSVAFLYRRGKVQQLQTPGSEASEAVAINNKGQVVGISSPASGASAVVLWEKGKAREINPFSNGPGLLDTGRGRRFSVFGINDRGVVIGNVYLGEEMSASFVWQNGKLVGPEPFKGNGDGYIRFLPSALNNKGQIVGATGWTRRFDSGYVGMISDNGKQREIGMLPGGTRSQPLAINDRGQIVGAASTDGVYRDRAFLCERNVMRDLSVPGSESSEARAINNRGQTVGTANIVYEETNGYDRNQWGGDWAVLWQSGRAYVLNDLIPKDAGWVLEQAMGINDRGQIIGVGHRSDDQGRSKKGGMRGFLLTPVPAGKR